MQQARPTYVSNAKHSVDQIHRGIPGTGIKDDKSSMLDENVFPLSLSMPQNAAKLCKMELVMGFKDKVLILVRNGEIFRDNMKFKFV